MKANMGTIDRVVRVLVAAGIAYFYFTGQIDGPLGTGLLVLAVIFALTSLVGTCPLYLPFGISTRKTKGA
jgi:predicted ABC-type sugar transport system permease subunit